MAVDSDPAAATTGIIPPLRSSTGLYGVRWNPCKAITYRVNSRGGYPGSLDHIRRAFREVGAATGVRFIYRGSTNYVSFRNGPDPRSDVTVSWATPRQVPKLGGRVAGLASTRIASHVGGHENIKGQIALDRTERLRRGFTGSGKTDWGQVIRHEIGHVMGLSHVDDRRQIMYPVVGASNHNFGGGDLRRLYRVGRAAGCVVNSQR
jgi:hypothetical protein